MHANPLCYWDVRFYCRKTLKIAKAKKTCFTCCHFCMPAKPADRNGLQPPFGCCAPTPPWRRAIARIATAVA